MCALCRIDPGRADDQLRRTRGLDCFFAFPLAAAVARERPAPVFLSPGRLAGTVEDQKTSQNLPSASMPRRCAAGVPLVHFSTDYEENEREQAKRSRANQSALRNRIAAAYEVGRALLLNRKPRQP